MCGADLAEHKESVVTEEDVRDYIGVIASKSPCNKVIDGLYLGSVTALQPSNINEKNITRVVQTAKGLESFYPKVGVNVRTMEAAGKIEVLRLDWDDVSNQTLINQLPSAVRFIYNSKASGHTVLVNCAQGKSRSSSLVIAFLMSVYPNEMGADFETALKFVRSKRFIAEPNVGFASQLKEFSKSDELAALRNELS